MTLPEINIGLLSLEEKVELRKKVQKQISEERRNKNLRVTTFIPALRINDFELVRNWSFEQKFIPKNTNWAFAKFAILNMIDLILTEMKTAEQNKQINDPNINNQNVPITSHNVVYDSNIEPTTEQ